MRSRRHRWLLPAAAGLAVYGITGLLSADAEVNDWIALAVGLAGTSWYGLSWLRDRREEP